LQQTGGAPADGGSEYNSPLTQENGMQVEQRTVGDIAIVKVTGRITLDSGGDVLLKDKVHSLMQQDFRQILVDLDDVTYVDSSGLGQLVQIYATASKHGGSLKLLHPTKRLHDLLVLSKLLTVFETFDDEAEALASFGKAAGTS
jgi:anti-sigma B factor antagonist